jgi:hypothetical protein
MGDEADGTCEWDKSKAAVKAVLESSELILRGRMRRRIPIAQMQRIHAPAVDLAKKLGISSESRVRAIGKMDDEELGQAIEKARKVPAEGADLIIARVDTADELTAALKASQKSLGRAPLWIVYRKGKGQPLSEATVRARGLAAGLVDTKVASVSSILTALRFNKRRA